MSYHVRDAISFRKEGRDADKPASKTSRQSRELRTEESDPTPGSGKPQDKVQATVSENNTAFSILLVVPFSSLLNAYL